MYSSCSNIYIYLYRHIKFKNGYKMYIYIYTIYAEFLKDCMQPRNPQKKFPQCSNHQIFWNRVKSKQVAGWKPCHFSSWVHHHGSCCFDSQLSMSHSNIWVFYAWTVKCLDLWNIDLGYLEVLGCCWYCRSRNFFPHCQLANATFMLASVQNLGDRSSL